MLRAPGADPTIRKIHWHFCFKTSCRIFLDEKYCIPHFYRQTTARSHESLLLHFQITTRPRKWCNRQSQVGAACSFSVTITQPSLCCSQETHAAQHRPEGHTTYAAQRSTGLCLLRFILMWIANTLMHNSLLVRIVTTPKGKICSRLCFSALGISYCVMPAWYNSFYCSLRWVLSTIRHKTWWQRIIPGRSLDYLAWGWWDLQAGCAPKPEDLQR